MRVRTAPGRRSAPGQDRWLYRLLAVVVTSAGMFSAAAQSTTPALRRPSGVAYDSAGNLFIADADLNQVLEVSLAGTLTVVAGTGVQGFAGDGGAATGAELNAPQGVIVGADGTLYIADTGNQRIRAVQDGTITTIAGSIAGFAGDGGAAAAAELNRPEGLALDGAGNLLLCDRGNQRVRRISDGVITTIAGDGIEGFSGDGGMATGAELDEPSAVVVASDGRIFIADTGNQRVRVLTLDGKIATYAGTGVAGFAGDGAQATAAELSRPSGLAIDAAGDLLIVDQNNHRLREVASSGLITTVAGTGAQGPTANGTTATAAGLNLPATAAVSTFGWPLFSDPANHALWALLGDGRLYEPAGLIARSTTLTQATPAAVYGTAQTSLTAVGDPATPEGSVQVFDGANQVAKAQLTGGAANVSLPSLSAGPHTLTAVYSGDGIHPAATSASTVTISPAPVVASAAGASVTYGAAIPVLSGTLTGVLAQDSGKVSAIFSSSAPPMPTVGSYPITASLSGPASGNYQLSLAANSGTLTVVPAASLTTLSPIATAYAGLPLQLTAAVGSTTSGVPTGTVQFFDGSTMIASATLVNGSATAVDLSPGAGSHTITATYSGDPDFLPSNSAKMMASVAAMPDFILAVGSGSSQTVIAGSVATYTLNVASANTPFTGVVTLTASGLPPGASASFSPSAVVPGSAQATVTMTISTSSAQAWLKGNPTQRLGVALGILALPLFLARRRRTPGVLLVCVIASVGLLGLAGCGARTASEAALPVQSYAVTVKGTSTNLAGALVVHSVNVTLGVE